MYKIDSPIPLSINLDSYCEDCVMADLSIDEVRFIADGKNYKTRMIQCSKHDLCNTLYRRIKYKIEKGEDDA